MNGRDELLAALIAERNDYRWFATPPKPPKTARDIDVPRDDELTCARRLRSLEDDSIHIHRIGTRLWMNAFHFARATGEDCDPKGGTKPQQLTGKVAHAWENESGPEGASTPESPALDQHPCLRGSANRG